MLYNVGTLVHLRTMLYYVVRCWHIAMKCKEQNLWHRRITKAVVVLDKSVSGGLCNTSNYPHHCHQLKCLQHHDDHFHCNLISSLLIALLKS